MSNQHGLGRIFQRRKGGVWWIGYYRRGREFRESTKSYKRKDAERLLQQRHAEYLAGRIHDTDHTTVAELLDGLLYDYEINGKSIKWARYVDLHLRPAFGRERANDLGSPHIQEYITKRRNQGIKNSTINRELSLLRRAFNLGLRADPPTVNRTPRIPKLREDNIRKGFFERAEYEALRKTLPEHLKPVLTFAYYTGTRRGEILSLRWSQVDLEHRIIRLEPGETKNKDARAIPLTTELAKMIQALHDKRDPRCPWVFPYDGKRFTRFEASWAKACTAAGLTTPDGKPAKLFHDLRRTGVRNLVRAGVPELIAMRITGHRTRSVFDRYNIVNETDLEDAARKLENYSFA